MSAENERKGSSKMESKRSPLILPHTMRRQAWFRFTLIFTTSFVFGNAASSASAGKTYTIGVGITGDVASFLAQWKPLLVDYLTSKVGSQYDPPISFEVIPVDYDLDSSTSVLIPKGVLDFVCEFMLLVFGGLKTQITRLPADARPTLLTCIQAEFGFTPLCTQRQITLGRETGAHGSVVYWPKSNQKIGNYSDLRNRRIAVGRMQSAAAFLLAFEVLARELYPQKVDWH